MLKNHLKIASRVFRKHKLYTLINIGGLTVGLATAILIFLWVKDERSVDQFHQNAATLYAVIQESSNNQGVLTYGHNTPGPMGPALKEEIPEIENYCRISNPQTLAFRYSDGHKGMENGIWADELFFDLLSFNLLQGSTRDVLSDPNQIVISESFAARYFNGEDPLGKVVTVSDGYNTFDSKVSGILQDTPASSSLQFDYVIPFSKFLLIHEWAQNWGSSTFNCIVQLTPEANLSRVNEKIEPFFTEHHEVVKSKMFLQPFTDRYLYGNLKPGRIPGGRITYVRLFTFIGLFILLIACINFMNLATARAGIRTKEIGVRKVVGAHRKSLIAQFMTEAMLLALLSAGGALLVAGLLLPAFSQIADKTLTLPLAAPNFLGALFITIAITGFVSGSYPALFLSAFKPVRSLKGQAVKNSGEVLFRKVLVVFQFTMSAALVIATLVIYYQIHYIKNTNLGMDRENVIFLSISPKIFNLQEAFANEIKALPGIAEVSYANDRPSRVYANTRDPIWEGRQEGESLGFEFLFTGHNFVNTMGLKIKEGRDFSRDIGTDTLNYILNETAVEMMNLEDPLGKEFDFWGRKGEIIGVVEDFHYRSLHDKIDPFVILLWPENTGQLLVKTLPGETSHALAGLKDVFNKFSPEYPFDYSFLDDDFERDYKSEMLIGKLANYFTAIVIFISCLGLFGLVSFTAERKTKEIGIRKVLGANLAQLVGLITKEFMPLVTIALIVAVPIAWYLMKQWLQDFYYRISLEPWIFMVAGVISVAIAMGTISYQSIKAGLANPVDALKNE